MSWRQRLSELMNATVERMSVSDIMFLESVSVKSVDSRWTPDEYEAVRLASVWRYVFGTVQ